MNAQIANSGHLTCRELIDLLHDYVEGGMETDREAFCRQHLDLCPECRDYLASYEATRRLAREAGSGAAGSGAAEEAPEELLAKILAAADADTHFN